MGGCQSTPAGDGQAISTNSSNNTSRGAAPASKYVEGTGQGQTYMQVGEVSETYSGDENDAEEALRDAQRTQGAQRATVGI